MQKSRTLSDMKNKIQNEKGLGLGLAIIAVLVVLGFSPFLFGFELGPIEKGPATILTGIYLQFLSIIFLLSYYFPHKTFLFRGVMWVCENFSNPRGRKMAFFYFGLAFLGGTAMLISGLGFL